MSERTRGHSALPAGAGSPPEFVPEAEWRAAPWHILPAAVLPAAGAHVVVVSAHPDDDVLALGGTIAELSARGCRVTPVTATDGEASHPASRLGDPARMEVARAAELRAALDVLGVGGEPVRLGLPDSGLVAVEGELRTRLEPVLGDADLVLATWSGDGHPDHEAVGRACLTVSSAPVWQFPVWAWHWARHDDERFPWRRLQLVDVRSRLEVKARAVACFRSQVQPLGPRPEDRAVLPPEVLEHFARPHEAVVV